MRAALRELLFTEDKLYPPRLGSLAAWYDSLDPVTMLAGNGTQITDGGAVALWGDKSGNSGANSFVSAGVNANFLTLSAGRTFGSGDFTVSVKIAPASVAAIQVLLNGGANSFAFAIDASGRPYTYKPTVVNNTTSTAVLSVFTTYVLTYVKSGTTGTYYVNGVAAGTTADALDYTAETKYVFGSDAGAFTLNGVGKWVRFYSSALDATAVAADAAGTVQANNVLSIDFSLAGKKLANGDTFVCATGQTVTLNSSGATGARIAGERDLFQGTLANRPVYLAYSGTKYAYHPGAAGAYFSTPDSVAASLTLNADLIWDGTLNDWTPAANTALISKLLANAGYELRVTTAGLISLIIGNGASSTIINSTVGLGSLAAGARNAVRAAFVSDTGAGQYSATFYAGDSIASMVQLGDVVTGASVAPADGGADLLIGDRPGATNILSGKTYYASVSGTVGGAAAVIFNPALYTSGTTFTASTGEVWTINGGAHIVTRTGLYFDGSNDYLKTAAFNIGQPVTTYFVGQQVSWTSADCLFDGNTTSASRAITQRTSSPNLVVRTSGVVSDLLSVPLAQTGVITGVFNGASSSIRLNRGTPATGSLGADVSPGFTLGSFQDGTNNANEFVCEIPVYSAAHATATQDRMALYAGRRHGFSV